MKCDQISASAIDPSTHVDIFAANQRLARTVNLGEALEFPDEGNWRWVDKEEIFYVLAKSGFTAVRVPINFAVHAKSTSPYSIQDAFWEDVDSVVNKAGKCGLVVIINMHNFGYESQITRAQSDSFLALWDQIASHYKDYPENGLYFELYNEPGDPYFWNTIISQGISVVRKTNPTRPIVIGLADWSQPSGLSALKLPDDQNLIVSFHYYSPMELTHQGADWLPGASEWLGTTWDGTPDQVAAINQDFDRIAYWAQSRVHPVPIFLGEFGSLSIADHDSRVRWTAAVRQAAEEHTFSWGYWDLCDTGSPTFGIFDCLIFPVKNATWDEGLFEALIPPDKAQ
jgi:endoglucanase